jgi:hypothetical protein
LDESLPVVLSTEEAITGARGLPWQMDDEEELRQLIGCGEGRHLEFKSSLRHALKSQAVNKNLTKVVGNTKVVCKTIAAFPKRF